MILLGLSSNDLYADVIIYNQYAKIRACGDNELSVSDKPIRDHFMRDILIFLRDHQGFDGLNEWGKSSVRTVWELHENETVQSARNQCELFLSANAALIRQAVAQNHVRAQDYPIDVVSYLVSLTRTLYSKFEAKQLAAIINETLQTQPDIRDELLRQLDLN